MRLTEMGNNMERWEQVDNQMIDVTFKYSQEKIKEKINKHIQNYLPSPCEINNKACQINPSMLCGFEECSPRCPKRLGHICPMCHAKGWCCFNKCHYWNAFFLKCQWK